MIGGRKFFVPTMLAFGFAFLYLLAIGFYFLAWAFSWNNVPAWLRWPRQLRQDGAL